MNKAHILAFCTYRHTASVSINLHKFSMSLCTTYKSTVPVAPIVAVNKMPPYHFKG